MQAGTNGIGDAAFAYLALVHRRIRSLRLFLPGKAEAISLCSAQLGFSVLKSTLGCIVDAEALTTQLVSGLSDFVSSWSALFGFNFFRSDHRHKTPVIIRNGRTRYEQQKTLNHWVVGSIPTRCVADAQRFT